MHDVAKLAGVSYQTVSRVLNTPELVADATRRRVNQAIAATGYRRNVSARALKRSRSDTIGVVHTGHTGVGPSSLLDAIETALRARGLATQVAVAAEPTDEDSRRAVDHILDYGVDGVIVVSTQQWLASAVRDMDISVPIVAVEAGSRGRGNISVVAVDQYQGARDIIDHLVAHGARRIDHISGPADWFDGAERTRAWRDALKEDPRLSGRLVEGDWNPEAGYAYGCSHVDDLPDAVFAANDQMAIGVLHALWENGIDVPGRIAVAGVDDLSTSAYACPPLTSLRQPFDEVGQVVVDTLMGRLQGYGASTISLPTQLVCRASTGA